MRHQCSLIVVGAIAIIIAEEWRYTPTATHVPPPLQSNLLDRQLAHIPLGRTAHRLRSPHQQSSLATGGMRVNLGRRIARSGSLNHADIHRVDDIAAQYTQYLVDNPNYVGTQRHRYKYGSTDHRFDLRTLLIAV